MHFSFGWFLAGVVSAVAGIIMTRFYKQIADNFGSGVTSYNRYKYIGIGLTVVGLVLIFNLHSIVLDFIANTFFGAMRR